MEPTPTKAWSFEAIGTSWWIGVYEPLSALQFKRVQTAVQARIEAFDRTYSRFRKDSLVTTIANKAGTYSLPHDSQALFTSYKKLYDLSDGAVTPLIGQVLSDAGYDADYSLRGKPLHRPPAWEEVLRYKSCTLTTKQPVLLDFGAAGKGYLVDIIAQLLLSEGITAFCIDASGDMLCTGLGEPLRIGLENPHDTSEALGIALLKNQALCGSAGNRRAWGKYHHIMDPKLLDSPRHIVAVWVVADTALLADGLTTALFFTSPKKLLESFSFAYVIVYADGSVKHSADFAGELFRQEL